MKISLGTTTVYYCHNCGKRMYQFDDGAWRCCECGNQITIEPVSKTWTKDELIQLIREELEKIKDE